MPADDVADETSAVENIVESTVPEDVAVVLLPAFQGVAKLRLGPGSKRISVGTRHPGLGDWPNRRTAVAFLYSKLSIDAGGCWIIGSSTRASIRLKLAGMPKELYSFRFQPKTGALMLEVNVGKGGGVSVSNSGKAPIIMGIHGQNVLTLGHKFQLGINSKKKGGFIGILPDTPKHRAARQRYIGTLIGPNFDFLGYDISPPRTESIIRGYHKWGRIQGSRRVYQLVGQFNGDFYAGKYYPRAEYGMARREMEFLTKIKHENIISAVELMFLFEPKTYQSPSWAVLITGLASSNLGGANFNIWQKSKVQEALIQICEGLQHIHSLYIAHGNINPSTILVRSLDPVHVQISNFQTAFTIYSNLNQAAEAITKQHGGKTNDLDHVVWNWDQDSTGKYRLSCTHRDDAFSFHLFRSFPISDKTFKAIEDYMKLRQAVFQEERTAQKGLLYFQWTGEDRAEDLDGCWRDTWSVCLLALSTKYNMEHVFDLSATKGIPYHVYCGGLSSADTLNLPTLLPSDFPASELIEHLKSFREVPVDTTETPKTPSNLSQLSEEEDEYEDGWCDLRYSRSGYESVFLNWEEGPHDLDELAFLLSTPAGPQCPPQTTGKHQSPSSEPLNTQQIPSSPNIASKSHSHPSTPSYIKEGKPQSPSWASLGTQVTTRLRSNILSTLGCAKEGKPQIPSRESLDTEQIPSPSNISIASWELDTQRIPSPSNISSIASEPQSHSSTPIWAGETVSDEDPT